MLRDCCFHCECVIHYFVLLKYPNEAASVLQCCYVIGKVSHSEYYALVLHHT